MLETFQFLERSNFKMKLVKRKVGKYIMMLDSKAGGIQKTLRGIGTKKKREPELLFTLEKNIKPGMTVMDLGANVGYVSLLMASLVGPKGKLYAVEPDPKNFELLQMNIKLNKFKDRTVCYEMAMSDIVGESNFYVGRNASNLGSLIKHKKSVQKPTKVKCDTITHFFEKTGGFPDLIKMDLEGGEVQVFAGMYDLMKAKNFPCKIIMELHPQFYPKKKGLEYWMKKYFSECGFTTELIISAAVPIPDKFKKWGYTKPSRIIRNKGFYENFKNKHALIASCRVNIQPRPGNRLDSPKIARYILISRG